MKNTILKEVYLACNILLGLIAGLFVVFFGLIFFAILKTADYAIDRYLRCKKEAEEKSKFENSEKENQPDLLALPIKK
jgi:hypothetical protein